MKKAEVIKAIERRNPCRVPAWDDYFSQELIDRHGRVLQDLIGRFQQDLILVEYSLPPEHQIRREGKLIPHKGQLAWTAKTKPLAPPPGYAPGSFQDEWGTIYEHLPNGVGAQVAVPAIQDWSQLDDFLANRVPNYDIPERFEVIYQLREKYPDTYMMGFGLSGPFERMCFMRDMENILMDMVLEKQNVIRLGEAITQTFVTIVRRYAEVGCDGFWLTDDWGSQEGLFVNPQFWREVFKPWYKIIVDESHRAGMHIALHSCGAIESIIPDIIELGFDVLHPIQPYACNQEKVARQYAGRITFWGGLDIQQILPHGTVSEVEAECKRLVDLFDGPDGGYIASPANTIMPETPLENIEAMARTFRQYGVRKNGNHG